MTGLYDHQGVLRYAGRDHADCLAYAELFDLAPGTYSLSALTLLSDPGSDAGAPIPQVAPALSASVLSSSAAA